jgi:TIR domain-containing protein/PDZ domain-containing protein
MAAAETERHVFLSHAAADREAAGRLADYLESRGWRIWWDRKIPAGSAYDETIEEALRRARCVVVLWTKAAVTSRWVRAEASDAARRDILVPVLLEEVVIPLEFRLVQAVDLRDWDRSEAAALEPLSEAVASVAQARSSETVAPAGLVPEGQARRRRAMWSPRVLIFAGVLLSVVAAGLWYWDGFRRETLDYYANVTKRRGLPEGVGALTAEQATARNVSVVFVRRGRRNPVEEIRIVNSSGNTPPLGVSSPISSVADLNPLQNAGSDGPLSSELAQVTRVTFSRDARGQVLEQSGFSRGGRRLYTIHFADQKVGEYKRGGFGTAVRESGIRYLRFSRIETGPNAGLDEKVMYLDDQQRPQPDEDGAYGYRRVFGTAGLVSESINLGSNGEDKPNNHGVLKEIRAYDAFGSVVEATTLDEHGALTASRIGPALTRLQYDQAGNLAVASFFDVKRQPMVVETLNAASFGLTYDRRGNITSSSYFGPDQKLSISQLGFAKQTIEWRTATRALARFYGANNQPIPALIGAFEALLTWDRNGYVIETNYRDEKGDATRVGDGCATVRMRYDDIGNVSELGCLNEQGAPTISSQGHAVARFTYDAFGHSLTTGFYRLDGEPGLVGDTFASIQRAYNAFGKLEKETYLDAHGRLVRNRQGIAAATFTYDTRGDEVAAVYWDERGGRATAPEGHSAIQRTYNERRLEVETTYLDSSDRPVRRRDGYATVRYEYDERGFVNRVLYLGPDGRPSRGPDGYISGRIKRNAAGERLEYSFWDDRNVPMIASRFGSAKRRWVYEAGRVVERSDHAVNGSLIMNAYGYATVKYSYDEHGRETGREVLDTQGRSLPFKVGVDRIAPGSVAAESGLEIGDLIVAYDGQTVSTSEQFLNKLELFRSDRSRELRIERDHQALSLDLPPGRLHGLELAERVPADHFGHR